MSLSAVQQAQDAGERRRASERATAVHRAAKEAADRQRAEARATLLAEARRLPTIEACQHALANLDHDGLEKAKLAFDSLAADPKGNVGALFVAWLDYRKAAAVVGNLQMHIQRTLDQLIPGSPVRTYRAQDPISGVAFADACDLESRIADLVDPIVSKAVNGLAESISAAGTAAMSTIK